MSWRRMSPTVSGLPCCSCFIANMDGFPGSQRKSAPRLSSAWLNSLASSPRAMTDTIPPAEPGNVIERKSGSCSFREASVADAELLEDWLKDQVAAVGAVPEQLAALLERRCRELSIEPPADDRIDRVVAPRSMRMMNVSSPASWAAWRRRRAGGLKGSCILPQTTPAIRLLISP